MNTSSHDPNLPHRFPEFQGNAILSHPDQAKDSRIYFLPEASEEIEQGLLDRSTRHDTSSAPLTNEDILIRAILAWLGLDAEAANPEAERPPIERTPDSLLQRLASVGIPSHFEKGLSLEDMAYPLEQGASVLLLVNMGELFDDPSALDTGDVNGIVLANAIGRDGQTDMIVACRLQLGNQPMQVDALHLQRAWLHVGGWLLVSDLIRPV